MALGKGRQGVLALNIKDKNTLYGSFMSFLQSGGLFIPSNKEYKLGDEVFMLISLMDEGEKIPVPGRVVWITPVGAGGNRQPGIGVEFKDGGAARTQIESYLPGASENSRPTNTL